MTAMIDNSPSRAPETGKRPVARKSAPVPDSPETKQAWVMAALLLGAMVREMLGDLDVAARGPQPYAGNEGVTRGENRVLQYLPTNLSTPEIARELHLSVNTIKTHQRHLYQKLDARSRTQAVEQARSLGLLGPSTQLVQPGHGTRGEVRVVTGAAVRHWS